VPSLAGKQDLIPGRQTDITLVPTTIGLYRGQCAEFCGVQHANMALVIEVDSYSDFIKWWDHQLQEAASPRTPLEQAGYDYVTGHQCAMCHNISGTPASGSIGPDLTHFASRRTIAAGALPMSTGNLYGWVEDPQSIKSGNQMPTIGLEPKDLHAVVAYLETLK
jgi:cytochrome c oxidase subunit 2